MKNPFKLDDVVYHATHGKGKIEGMNMPNHVKENGRDILVRFENSPMEGFNCLRQYAAEELSFKEWPKPDHKRPIEDGWWLCSYADGTVTLRQKRGNEMYDSVGSRISRQVDAYKFHRYLGKDWK